MTENNNVPAYRTMPAVAALNKVPGFEPTRFIRIAKGGGLVLDLKYKKLWFRLACPNGVVKTAALTLNEQMAVIEAQVFRDKADTQPVSSFISTKYAAGNGGKLYIEAAQYEAADQALLDAGFGVQFCDVSAGTSMDRLVASDTMMGATMPSAWQQPPTMTQQPPVAAAPMSAAQPVVMQQPVMAAAPMTAQPPIAMQAPVQAAGMEVQPPPVAAMQPVVAAVPVVAEPPIVEPVSATPQIAAQPVMQEAPPVVEPMQAIPSAATQPMMQEVAQPPMAEPAFMQAPPAIKPPLVSEIPVVPEQPTAVMPPPIVEPVPMVQPSAEVQAPIDAPAVLAAPPAILTASAVPAPVEAQAPVTAPPIIDGGVIPFPDGENASPTQVAITGGDTGTSMAFTPDMPVESISAQMTREQALAIIVDSGVCAGWTLERVLKERPASLKWYLNGYPGKNNVLRAGAQLLLKRDAA